MDTVGYQLAPQIPPHILHNSYGFLFLQKGDVLVIVDDEPFLTSSNTLILIPPGSSFGIKYYNGSVGFMGGFTELFLKDASYPVLHCGHTVQKSFNPSDAEFLRQIFLRIWQSFTSDNPDIPVMMSGIDLILSHIKEDKAVMHSHRLAAIFLEEVFDWSGRVQNVSEYAKRMGVSTGHLNRCVKQYSGRSAVSWVQLSRLNMAKQLLRNNEQSIIDVASAVGIDDQAYFSRFFKKMSGLSPREFRKLFCTKSPK